MIVGGHSHTELHEVVWQETKNKKRVPIVQAGHHAEWLGRVLIDYDKKTKSLTVKEYGLLPVNGDEKDHEMEELVHEANEDLHREYGEEWLNEVVGTSSLNPKHEQNDNIIWQHFLNDAMKEATGADFAIHTPALSGSNYPVGSVTRRALYEGNPRTFDFADKYGYNVYTARIMGGWIKMIAAVTMRLNIPLYFSGVEFTWSRDEDDGSIRIWDVTHNGKMINPFRYYRVAFSEGIVRGAYGISPMTRFLVHEGEKERIPMWQALEDKFRRDGTITPEYLNSRHPASGRKMERMVIPDSN